MSQITIGSLFSGSGMLDEAVRAVVGGTVAWHAEHEPATEKTPKPTQAAARVLAYRYPGVPNLGDISTVDWAAVPRVDVLTGGFPCQDVSHAGKRAGLKVGTRSGLWARMADAIEVLRPGMVVIENVRGLTSACADSEMGQCPRCVGGSGPHDPVLRALGRVLGDLAELGYDARWHGLPASDVGAPHERFRIFIVASDAANEELQGPAFGRFQSSESRARRDVATADAERGGRDGWSREQIREPLRRTTATGPGEDAAADTPQLGCREGRTEPAGIIRGSDAAERGASTSADTHRDAIRIESVTERRGITSTVAGLHREVVRWQLTIERHTHRCDSADTAWGVYEPAIRRWEHILGRPAPAPTETGTRGGQRLSRWFDEWMMGWPDGWVTDVPGITYREAVKICGNGVVPQQAATALSHMLNARAAA